MNAILLEAEPQRTAGFLFPLTGLEMVVAQPDRAVLVTNVKTIIETDTGSPSVEFILKHGTDIKAAGTTILSKTTTEDNAGEDNVVSVSVPAGDEIWIVFTTVVETRGFAITMSFG